MEKVKPALTNELILTAGPYINYKEVEYCADAAKNGWNNHHSDYIRKFESLFKSYVGVEHGFTTSSCTGALHLALKAKGIGPGDEVIVPETTWIATAAAVVYVGAKPVFADIQADTWVLDPYKVEKLINKNTKAIIPVHLYGQPVDMDPVNELAKKHNLFVLEDAAPSIGTIYKGKKTGSLGDAAAVSFQGAKALVTGEGGFFLTKDEELMKRAWFYNDHGRDPNRTLYNIEIGHKYKMSNIQAALGLAQVEKAEEVVAKKRQIFSWYQERLGDIEELALNVEKPDTRNIYWMTSAVLGEQIKFSRDEFMAKLKERNVDSRPMFHPMSSFPMFENADNPVAYSIPMRGINLPSGHERTEEEIDYVCSHIRDLLDKGVGKTSVSQPTGILALRDNIENQFKKLKESPEKFDIKDGYLEPVAEADLNNPESISLLTKWRDQSQEAFPSQFKVTEEGTKRWLENALLKVKDRFLFWVCDSSGRKLGHVGLFRFDYKESFCELDNIIRGEQGCPGIMQTACQFLVDYCKKAGLKDVYLRVFADNDKAIKLYSNIGFEEVQRSPLRAVRDGDNVQWLEIIKSPYETAEKYFVTMKFKG